MEWSPDLHPAWGIFVPTRPDDDKVSGEEDPDHDFEEIGPDIRGRLPTALSPPQRLRRTHASAATHPPSFLVAAPEQSDSVAAWRLHLPVPVRPPSLAELRPPRVEPAKTGNAGSAKFPRRGIVDQPGANRILGHVLDHGTKRLRAPLSQPQQVIVGLFLQTKRVENHVKPTAKRPRPQQLVRPVGRPRRQAVEMIGHQAIRRHGDIMIRSHDKQHVAKGAVKPGAQPSPPAPRDRHRPVHEPAPLVRRRRQTRKMARMSERHGADEGHAFAALKRGYTLNSGCAVRTNSCCAMLSPLSPHAFACGSSAAAVIRYLPHFQ